MDKIPVIIVDDDETDRYIAKRCLTNDEGFGAVFEASAGDAFLEDFFNDPWQTPAEDQDVLVLMDVNMPRMDGFETVQELENRVLAGKAPPNLAVMMFTSSDSPQDKARAKTFQIVKAYITKPLDRLGVTDIREAYYA